MAPTVLFMVMYLLGMLFLLVSSILSSISTVQAHSSLLYPTDPKVRSAYGYLLVSTILDWVALVLLGSTIAVAIFGGGLPSVEISEKLKTKRKLTLTESANVYGAEKQLLVDTKTKKVVSILIIVAILLVLLSVIFNLIALTKLAQITRKDSNASRAYIKSYINLVLGIFQLVFLMISVLGYAGILSSHRHQVKLASTIMSKTDV